jgi:hypothetical protein
MNKLIAKLEFEINLSEPSLDRIISSVINLNSTHV